MIAEVVFNLPIGRSFDYRIPSEWNGRAAPGMRVAASFGHRRLIGMIRQVRSSTSIKQPKTLSRLIDDRPVMNAEAWQLAVWLAGHCGCSVGEACASLVPFALRFRAPEQDDEAEVGSSCRIGPVLTQEQQVAWRKIHAAIARGSYQPFLIHGVTGSGKTELYLRAIQDVLTQERTAICLVPEIALTPQTIDRFRERFGSHVSLWHSRLTSRERAREWQRLAGGSAHVVVGTRSAVFAPVPRLGLVILDEEHDQSYKQDVAPRYHAREVAFARAREARAVVLMGSATPSIEMYYHACAARSQRLKLLELTRRVKDRPLPQVDIVDMRQEPVAHRRTPLFSRRLQRAMEQVVARHEQAILLLNRRGFARVIQCPTCGIVVRCTHCDVPLIYHASAKDLRCHYCNRTQTPPEMCPACQRGYLRFRGSGTERVESELHRVFPASSIGRMDKDATKGRGRHRQLYEAIRTQQIDMLVGTQMVAKGLDIPQVTLVGVISADTALNIPDFRAGERTFDLLTQVAGRAGRGDRPGRVIIQTFCPGHYAICAASRHDYHEFYRQEIAMRERLRLPPFVHLIELTIQGRRRERVQETATALADALRTRCRRRRITLLGPAPHRIEMLRGTCRWRIILKAQSQATGLDVVQGILQDGRRFRGSPVIVDVDPL